MYVALPQFFFLIVILPRNAAQNILKHKSEPALVRAHNTAFANFEKQLDSFNAGFTHNFDPASRRFQSTIAETDKTIKSLETTKETLMRSENNLLLANTKLQNATIKRLAKKSNDGEQTY